MATRAKPQMNIRGYASKKTVLFSKQTSGKRVAQNTRFIEFRFKLSTWSGFLPMRLILKHFADKVAGTLCLGMASVGRPSRNDSSSRRSMPYVASGDSHIEDAIEDCIQFINSSSTFSRTTPTATPICH